MTLSRLVRVRALEALEQAVKQFRTREELYPLRVPSSPLAFDEVMVRALGDEAAQLKPTDLRSRTLLHLEWDDDSSWDLWVIVLPSGLKVYCDSGEEETRLLASGGKNLGDESDRLLLERLADSGGEDFGIEMAGGVPTKVRSSLTDRGFLVEVFVDLFEGTSVEDDLRGTLGPGEVADGANGRDFQADVERWLTHVMR
ncbi:MAG: hypothetical protein ABIX28_22870 [Vicinamibacterales bacterium]